MSADLAPPSLPVFGVGHSAGALLHLLIGATADVPPTASNVLISFNNKCAAGVGVGEWVAGVQFGEGCEAVKLPER